MHRSALCSFVLLLATTSLWGCPVGRPTAPTAVKARSSATPTGILASGLTGNQAAGIPRVIDQTAGAGELTASVQLTGKVKLISDHGAGIVSNNGGAIVSNNGSSLISNNGGGVISSHGGALTGKLARQLLTATGPVESVLADATIEVHDAQDRVLVDAANKPLSATSDHAGAFAFAARLPRETLLLHVRLYNGGTLRALASLATGATTLSLDIDTASSLGASYVLDRFVNGKQTVLDRLPALEAAALHRDLADALGALPPGVPQYETQALAGAVETLRTKAAPLDATLGRIKAILLLGQAKLGAGEAATRVALSNPTAIAGDGANGILIAEGLLGRIRRLAAPSDPTGRLVVVAGGGPGAGQGALGTTFTGVRSLLRAPDGTLYLSEPGFHRVRKILPDGTVVVAAGTGSGKQGAPGGKANETTIMRPLGLALGTDGTLYISEGAQTSSDMGRLLAVTPDGLLSVIATPNWGPDSSLTDVAVAPDGTLFIFQSNAGVLAMRTPAGVWSELAHDSSYISASVHLLVSPDGGVWAAIANINQIVAFTRAGARTVFAGTGRAGFAGDGGPAVQATLSQPAGMWRGADGTVFFAEMGNALVRAIAPDGTIRTVAGAQGLSTSGAAQALAVNGPGALAFDAQGRLVFAELGSGLVKRLEDQNVKVLAGTSQGYAGDGGPATAASFDALTGLALQGDAIVLADSNNNCIRRINTDGTVVSLAGRGHTPVGLTPVAAAEVHLREPFSVTVGADNQVYFVDLGANQILRITDAGKVELVAGSPNGAGGDDGDGGPANQAHLFKPGALQFGPDGSLYVADTGNLRIRRIDKSGIITSFAGMAKSDTLSAMLSNQTNVPDLTPALKTPLAVPGAIAFDARGNMFISELGTAEFAGSTGIGDVVPPGLPVLPARIRRIDMADPLHPTHIVAGPGGALLTDPNVEGGLHLPVGMAFDSQGQLAIADGGTNQIQMLPAGSF